MVFISPVSYSSPMHPLNSNYIQLYSLLVNYFNDILSSTMWFNIHPFHYFFTPGNAMFKADEIFISIVLHEPMPCTTGALKAWNAKLIVLSEFHSFFFYLHRTKLFCFLHLCYHLILHHYTLF